MSNHIISMAYKRDLKTAMRKSVMILLADKASDDGGGVYASKQTMADELCCSKQTVIETIKAFIAEGLVVEIGKRRNANGFTVEYAININVLDAVPLVGCHANKQSTRFTGKPNIPVNEAYPTSQPDLPHQSATLTQTLIEPSMNPLLSKDSKRAKPFEFVCPDGVDPLDWQALIANRKQKRAALSEGAYRQIINKLERWANDGWPPGPIVANAAERGWTTIFETDEMKGKKNGQQTTDGRTMGRTEAAARAAIAEIGEAAGGRNAPASGTGQFPRNGGGAFPQSNPLRTIGYDPRRP